AVAAIVLLNAFRTRDFTFAYVAEHSSKALPFPYVYTAFWGGQAGSLLLWLLVLTALGSAAGPVNPPLAPPGAPWTGAGSAGAAWRRRRSWGGSRAGAPRPAPRGAAGGGAAGHPRARNTG